MDSSEKLARVEGNIGYVFEAKLIGIESLNSGGQPIYYNQQHHNLRRNNDLAIIGDTAINLVLNTLWYRSRDSQGSIICLAYRI